MSSSHTRVAWSIGVLLVLLLLTLGIHTASADHHHQTGLVTLSTGKPDPRWPTWVSGTGSRVLGTYDDGGDTWSVYVRYRGCPVTSRGAFRVTVYENRYKWNSIGQGSWVPDLSKPATRYSTTATDYHRSDSVLYTWRAHFESAWQVHIQVPDSRGCTWWKLGAETN